MSTCSSSKSSDLIPLTSSKPSAVIKATGDSNRNCRNFHVKEKYRSPNSTPATTPNRNRNSSVSFNKRDVLKENANTSGLNLPSGKIDVLIEKYKKDISQQSYRMQELKKNMQKYDCNIQNLLQNKAQDSEKRKIFADLENKNKELKERLKNLELNKEERTKQENAHLESYLQEKIKAKSQLVQQISSIEEENARIESTLAKYSKPDLLNKNLCLRSEHASLTDELAKLQSTFITQEEYLQVQSQIKDLEEMQNKLVKENNLLREEIIKEQKIELAGHESCMQQRSLCREVAMIKKEISMLNCLAKGVFKGQQADLSFILGAGPISEMEGKTLSEAIGEINSELNVLKQYAVSKDQQACRVF